ncbi:MAG TPA: diacylglycerol kinase family protein [Pyrinomonadaceae bacterium]|nr:diacylglycerol kinase family protein [Pyrinomonadaceae bacterium]
MLIIINNVAAKARQSWPKIKSQLDAAGVNYQTHFTNQQSDATLHARAALKAGTKLIVVVGGDGTLSEAAEGFFHFQDRIEALPTPINPDATLAILPAGTGDDFARGLRRQRAPLQEWIDTLLSYVRGGDGSCGEAVPQKIDVLYGLCDGFQKPFVCLNASTMGIGGETAGRVAAQGRFMRNFSGEFRFVFAAVGALAAWRERRVRITVDDKTVADGPMNLVGVANGLYAGGGMMLSTSARLDDGKLDVITASGLSRANVVTELSRIHTGGHLNNPKVTLTQGKKVRIETLLLQDAMPLEADGNVRGVTPVQFEVIPGALRFLI